MRPMTRLIATVSAVVTLASSQLAAQIRPVSTSQRATSAARSGAPRFSQPETGSRGP
jgi:hypothetical protein